MRFIIDIAIAFLVLGITEAVIKPIAKQWVMKKIVKFTPVVFETLDKQMPELLKAYNGKQLEQVVRTKLEMLTGESWSDRDIDQVFKLYDPRITADKTPGCTYQASV
jgi:hypothetical protein